MKMRSALSSLRRGFTIMETLLAIGIISMLLSIFLTLFMPAKDMVRSAISREEAERITGILRSEMTQLRDNERLASSGSKSTNFKFISGFDKAFTWIQRTKKPGTAIAVFAYRADTSKTPLADGSYPAAKENIPAPGNTLISMACPINDSAHKDNIKKAVGPAFLVRMTYLDEQPNGDFELEKSPGVISKGSSPEAYVSKPNDENSWGGVIFVRADFFVMTPPNPDRYKSLDWDQLGKPAFSVNLSVRR